MLNKRLTKILLTILGCSLVVMSAPVTQADDVFVFYSLANRDLWDALAPSLDEYEVETYRVDLLALADYSAKQKAIARANRRNVAVVVGPRAGSVLSDLKLNKPLVAVEVRETVETTAETTVYLYHGSRPVGLVALPRKIGDPSDLDGVSLQTVSAFRVAEGADLGAILATVISRIGAG